MDEEEKVGAGRESGEIALNMEATSALDAVPTTITKTSPQLNTRVSHQTRVFPTVDNVKSKRPRRSMDQESSPYRDFMEKPDTTTASSLSFDPNLASTSGPVYGDPIELTEKTTTKRRRFYQRCEFWCWGFYVLFLIVSTITLILGSTIWYGMETQFVFRVTLFVFCGLLSLAPIWGLVTLLFLLVGQFYFIRKNFFFYVHGTQLYLVASLWSLIILILWAVIMYPFFCCGGPYMSKTILVLRAFGSLLALTILMTIKQVLVNILGLSFERGAFKKRAEEFIFADHALFLLKKKINKSSRLSRKNLPLKKDDVSCDNEPKDSRSTTNLSPGNPSPASTQDGEDQNRPTTKEVEGEEASYYDTSLSTSPEILLSTQQMAERIELLANNPLIHTPQHGKKSTKDPSFFYGRAPFHKMFPENELSYEISDYSIQHHALLDRELRAARQDAHLIFSTLKHPDRSFLTEEDFERLGDKMKHAFRLFKRKQGSYVTQKAIEQTLIGISQEKRLIARSINDSRSIVTKLNTLLTLIFLIIAGMMSFLIFEGNLETFQTNFQQFLLSISALLVAYTFLVGPLFRDLINCILFVFMMHPYDVGDRILIDDMNLIVHRVNFMSTEFIQWDGQRMYIPNTVLLGKVIHNMRRSNPQKDTIALDLHISTPPQMIETLRQRLKVFFETNKSEYDPDFSFDFQRIEKSTKLCFTLLYQGHENWQEYLPRWHRRARLLLFLHNLLQELHVEYSLPPQPVYISQPMTTHLRGSTPASDTTELL
jgi:mechanosensitive ion channel protein 4/5/6/7/8/9/10